MQKIKIKCNCLIFMFYKLCMNYFQILFVLIILEFWCQFLQAQYLNSCTFLKFFFLIFFPASSFLTIQYNHMCQTFNYQDHIFGPSFLFQHVQVFCILLNIFITFHYVIEMRHHARSFILLLPCYFCVSSLLNVSKS